MMLLRLKPTAVWMSSSPLLPSKRPNYLVGGQQVCLSVNLDGRDHLDLETGEIFQNPSYARSAKHESISAQLIIREASEDGGYDYNQMSYFEGVSSEYDGSVPSQISFQMFLPQRDFQDFVSNIRSSLLPSIITVELALQFFTVAGAPKPAIKYGWEPDGSGMKWSNLDKNNRRVKIEGISFQYDLLKSVVDEATGEELPADTASISQIATAQGSKIKDALMSVRREVKQLGWVVLLGSFIVASAIYYSR